MTAWNVVRFRVKPGREEEFLAAHRAVNRGGFKGMRRFSMFKTGNSSYCVIGEWQSLKNLADARPQMIGTLDTFRDCLEDLGGGLGGYGPGGYGGYGGPFGGGPGGFGEIGAYWAFRALGAGINAHPGGQHPMIPRPHVRYGLLTPETDDPAEIGRAHV